MAGLHIDAADKEAARDWGSMVASATNISLALELYLKAFAILLRQPSRRVHDLDRLYADLPDGVRKDIEADYEAAPKPAPVGEAVSVDVRIIHRDAARTEYRADPNADHSLPAVLRRSSGVFERWRYRGPPAWATGRRATADSCLPASRPVG
jgi:hypothetical protein